MSEMTRRSAIALAAVAPFAGLTPSPAYAWPHPDVGIPPSYDPKGGSVWFHADTFADKHGEAYRTGAYLAGAWIGHGGRVIDPGRVYTREEWARVGEDVSRFLQRRNKILFDLPPQRLAHAGDHIDGHQYGY